MVEDALVDLAGRHHRGDAVETAIREACETLRRQDFSLALPITLLSKTSPNKAARARVVRCLNRDVGEAGRIEVTSNSEAAPDARWMTEPPTYLDRRDSFASSAWSDGRFIVRDRFGKITPSTCTGRLDLFLDGDWDLTMGSTPNLAPAAPKWSRNPAS
ncbi:hypothetical protein U5640_43235 [Streptomyces sp. SS7]|uniref:hypothetical protein n=1 Tax=Streptomyces sp. SS7 TaxID=3108485 RepID=UPI0030EC7061